MSRFLKNVRDRIRSLIVKFDSPGAFLNGRRIQDVVAGFGAAAGRFRAGLDAQRLRRFKKALCTAGVLALAAGCLVMLEVQTHVPAAWLGEILTGSNAYRQQKGGLWSHLRARRQMREAMREPQADPFQGRGGLPASVAAARFELERVPETGLPTFVAIWRTELPGVRQQPRAMPEVVQSLGAFRKGFGLLQAARLPDSRYRTRVRQEVQALYRQVGTVSWGNAPGEDLPAALPDSLPVIPADTVRAAVEVELEREFWAALEEEEVARLLKEYEAGRVSQVVIQRGIGLYHGEVAFVDPGRVPVAFELTIQAVADLFHVEEPEGVP